MAVGEYPFPTMPPVAGVAIAAAGAGIKKPGRDDVLLFALAPGSTVAGVFTQNAFCAAPVKVCRAHLAEAEARYLIINSGNANACTGDSGYQNALTVCASVAAQMGVSQAQVLPFSTGGISKGAGMINPNMATMLGYIATDAAVAADVLQQLVRESAGLSFNRITIDGDTSTNDACMLMASGQAGNAVISDTSSGDYALLRTAVIDVATELAQAIVADGEGATKFVTIDVTGGASHDECLKVAYAVAHSPLIKTALFASDPNWGRIVAAIGYAGVTDLDDEAVTVHLNDVLIVEHGGRAASYTEEQGQQVMNGERITIAIDLGRGVAQETLWTTDLSYEYVRINADYRT